jgi:cytochrome oxidase assembly protein ShyY1
MGSSGQVLKFDIEWRITLCTLVMLPFMVGLGFWQLERAAEKEALGASWEARQREAPAALTQVWNESAEGLAYLPVRLSGEFLPDKYFLLDNRIQAGQFGYEVLAVMQITGEDRVVLVNRGWIAGDPARIKMPDVPAVRGPLATTGHVYVAPGKPYLLAEQQLDGDWPKVLQAVEMEKIKPVLVASGSTEVFPYTVRIAAGEPGALAVDWQVINVTPQKHRAYAVQWFTMAVALAVFYLLRSSNLWLLLRPSGGIKGVDEKY